jgi:hypothetical protein
VAEHLARRDAEVRRRNLDVDVRAIAAGSAAPSSAQRRAELLGPLVPVAM